MSEVCPEQIAQAKRTISRILIFIKHYDIRGDHKTNKNGLLAGITPLAPIELFAKRTSSEF